MFFLSLGLFLGHIQQTLAKDRVCSSHIHTQLSWFFWHMHVIHAFDLFLKIYMSTKVINVLRITDNVYINKIHSTFTSAPKWIKTKLHCKNSSSSYIKNIVHLSFLWLARPFLEKWIKKPILRTLLLNISSFFIFKDITEIIKKDQL